MSMRFSFVPAPSLLLFRRLVNAISISRSTGSGQPMSPPHEGAEPGLHTTRSVSTCRLRDDLRGECIARVTCAAETSRVESLRQVKGSSASRSKERQSTRAVEHLQHQLTFDGGQPSEMAGEWNRFGGSARGADTHACAKDTRSTPDAGEKAMRTGGGLGERGKMPHINA
jgi:hypothetical protein